jgi:anaerobic selenocysteine-containing dehydrogenase
VRDEELQPTTQESMFSFVRLSNGGMKSPRGEMRSEVEIICGIGARLLPADGPIDFATLRNHDAIRKVMSDVVPGYADVANLSHTREEFHVADRVRHEPEFPLPGGRARFISVSTPVDGRSSESLRLMTIRSEGQFNTVVYEEHDRYRNQATRDVILMNARDIDEMGLRDGERVDVTSEVGTMRDIRVAAFTIARGCAAMYYPEANVLVDRRVDPKSGTPSFKNVLIRIDPPAR